MWKFQNPEIKANAFYLYVFLLLFNHRQMGLLSQIYNLQFNNQSVELNESIKDCQKLVTL